MAYIENGESALSIRNKMNEGLLVPATANKSGTVLNITAPEGSKYIYFTAPSNYSTSDTYKINGTIYTLRSQNNTQPSNPWKSGTIVKMFLNGTTAYVEDFGSTDYLPITGGTLTGDLRLKGSTNYGRKINFGDGDYVYIQEKTDDDLEIKATDINFLCTNLTQNGQPIGGGQAPVVGELYVARDASTAQIGPFEEIPERFIFFGNRWSAYYEWNYQSQSSPFNSSFYKVFQIDREYVGSMRYEFQGWSIFSKMSKGQEVDDIISYFGGVADGSIVASGSKGNYYVTFKKDGFADFVFANTNVYHPYIAFF